MKSPVKVVDRPECGYWLLRVVKGGPEVPACIRWETECIDPTDPTNLMDRPPVLVGEINGQVCDPIQVWHRNGREIDEAEYRGRVNPNIDPWKAIPLSNQQMPF